MPADDPVATLRLLWRHVTPAPAARRGPRQRLSVDEVVAAAIRLASSVGLAALSMRALAKEVGIGAMSLYTYVSSREQLLQLMVDQAMADTPLPRHDDDLATRLTTVARVTYDEHLRHPWLDEAAGLRPGLGPHALARYEWQLQALDGVGLDDLEMDQTVTLLSGFAIHAARLRRQHESPGQTTDSAWWETVGPTLAELSAGVDAPLAARVGTSAGEAYGAARDPDLEFRFGLARIVDGLVHHVRARHPERS